MHHREERGHIKKLSALGVIITLGIVYGDIGTSPLYVFGAIIDSARVVDQNFILGALSCIIWTLTIQTTVKYILITLRADNNGEGGIFALFALLRRRAPWVFIFAIIGGSTLLADGIITPSITVVSAIEGLQIVNPKIPVIPIVIAIISFLFFIQQFGTKKIGESFGPIMFFWFAMLGIMGAIHIFNYPVVFKSFNPVYAIKVLINYPKGFLILGAVFLCTTGAEALYSDLGHCGLKNIRISWIYVKITLILNYLGQGAWVLMNTDKINPDLNPFYAIMPAWFLIPGIIIATVAAVIASQALISGSFTLVSEAISLNLWPKLRIQYPTDIKGQMYVPTINWLLYICCVFIIVFFQKSSNMEAAYGLSISITMIMTTILLSVFMYKRKYNLTWVVLLLLVYGIIEGAFLIANLQKFAHGGWVTIAIASVLIIVMYVWYRGRKIRNSFLEFVKVEKYKQLFIDLKADQSLPQFATNLVYLIRADRNDEVEEKVVFSIFNKRPKRADMYWFVHLDIDDQPHKMDYEVKCIIPGTLMRIDFRLGFKVIPRINLYFRRVVEELSKNNEVDVISRHESLRRHQVVGDFRFVIIDTIQNYDFDFPPFEQWVVDMYAVLKKIALPDVKAFGLDTSIVEIEKVPIVHKHKIPLHLKRKDHHDQDYNPG
jgi:KUP system potassium uptake protein